MKNTLMICILAAAVLSLTGCSALEQLQNTQKPEEASLGDTVEASSQSPDGAVAGLMEGIKEYDLSEVNTYLSYNIPIDTYVPDFAEDVLQQVLDRMQYGIVDSEVDGDKAAVELNITTVDAQSAVNDAISSLAGYMVKQKIAGKDPSTAEMAAYLVDSIDVSGMDTVTKLATAYMVRDGNGDWTLDLDNRDNLELVNAMTGGSLDVLENLQDMADTYGIDLSPYYS